jgi:hypothetical protein
MERDDLPPTRPLINQMTKGGFILSESLILFLPELS